MNKIKIPLKDQNTRVCADADCWAQGQPQSASKFYDDRPRCKKCYNREARTKRHGYGGRPRRTFVLAHHQYLVAAGLTADGRISDGGFKLLRCPKTKQAVARRHPDLKPGEVSLVLE